MEYPLVDVLYYVETDQIIPVKVLGDLNVTTNTRHMRFCVKNVANIAKKFHSFLDGR